MCEFNELGELHSLLLELLIDFDKLCKDLDINYYLSGGTLLGAVRHQGFIPWDDDADVMLLRKDYELLLKASMNMKINNRKIFSLNNKTFARDYARFVRTDYYKEEDFVIKEDCPYLGIDIFPVDFVPEKNWLFNIQCIILHYLKILLDISNTDYHTGSTKFKRFIRDCLRPILKFIGRYRLAYLTNVFCKLFNSHCEINVAAISGINGKRERWKFEDYRLQSKAEFEGYLFPIPLKYHIYLTNLYGDFMQLPPKSKRKTHGVKIQKVREDGGTNA